MSARRTLLPDAPLGETFAEAFANLRAQGRRSALALLGILIGTASIIAMLNVGHMAQRESLKLFSDMGVDMLQILAVPTGEAAAGFPREAVERLPQSDPAVAAALPLATGRGPVRSSRKQTDLSIVAMPPGLVRLARLPVAEGRSIAAIDDCGFGAVLGHKAAEQLSAPGAAAGVGSRVLVGDYGFTVIGVFAPVVAETLDPTDYNNAVFVPLSCARRVLPGADPNVAMIRLKPGVDGEPAGQRIIAALARPGSSLQAMNAQRILQTMNAQKAVHSRMLAAIGAISLLVGGIGVMNVMLMSVMERRREIGLRAAIGATPRDVQALFVIEAAVLTLVGGVVGTLFGLLAGYAIAVSSGWDFGLAVWTLPLGPGVAGLIGLVFGLYPAITASRLDPIEALRAD
ncbi:ABC transporter permease [Sphingomonas gilva]|uniref:ABC transporter permease n=1 Tax=Sphingomonas gilva TaxID=2305907 RepID=A0A396RX66_9SPHN|nr:ABC transporter permease [Sphingomonas gilva]RHW19063.1 ABC transporter permease [Sphingomonas gilva]